MVKSKQQGDDLSDLLDDGVEECPPEEVDFEYPETTLVKMDPVMGLMAGCGANESAVVEYIRADLLRDAFDPVSLRAAYQQARSTPGRNQAGILKIRELLYG